MLKNNQHNTLNIHFYNRLLTEKCYNNNNNNNISLLQTHGPYTYKKMLNIYKNSNNNIIISQRKIVLSNITLISTIAEWESEYKQYESCMPL